MTSLAARLAAVEAIGTVPAAEAMPAPVNLPLPADAKTDYSGLWFDLVAEKGEFVGMRGGRRDGTGKIGWVFPSHANFDGLGGFVHILRGAFPGRRFVVPGRKSRAPSLFTRIAATVGLIVRPVKSAAPWRGHDTGWKGQLNEPGREFAVTFLSKAETQRLAERAKAQAVPLNSLLLKTLSEASSPDLGEGPHMWMMPVNMRGPVQLERDTSNQTGYLQIEVPKGGGPSQVHEQLKIALKRKDHWASWIFLNAGRIVGYRGLSWIYPAQVRRYKGRPFVGSFSNLGSWMGVGEWCVCPPVAVTCPVGVGAITCDGRLSLTIEAHPSIDREAGWTQALMNRWVDLLTA